MLENIKEIETGLGLTEGTLKDAIASDEAVKVDIPKGKFVDTETHVIKSNEDHETFVSNIKTESKVAGVEMAVKEFKRENNLEFEGKSIENLIKASNTKALADANIEPNEKIKGYLVDIESLQTSNKALKGDLQLEVNKGAMRDVQIVNDKSILSHMKGEYNLSGDRMLGIFNTEYSLKNENGVQVVLKGGEIMKDENRSPITLESVVDGFTKEFIKIPEGGTGAGSEGGGTGGGNLAAFNKRQVAAGNNEGSEAYMKEYNLAISDKTLVV